MLFIQRAYYYYVIVGLVAVALLVTWMIARSRLGYYAIAIREDETAAEVGGVPSARVKRQMLAISAALTAVGGTFYAQFYLFIQPEIVLGWDPQMQMILGTMVGGPGTVAGPVVGSLAFSILTEALQLLPIGWSPEVAAIRAHASHLGRDPHRRYAVPARRVTRHGPPRAEETGPGGESVTALRIAGLRKRFKGLEALRGVSFEVADGEVVGIVGANGAGKTTLFNTLSGIIRPDTGSIRLHGQEISGLAPHMICKLGIGRAFQITRPFLNLTCLENVTIGALNREPRAARARERAMTVLAQVGLDDKAEMLGRDLSVSWRKRLRACARPRERPEGPASRRGPRRIERARDQRDGTAAADAYH